MLSTKPPRCKFCRKRTEKQGQLLHSECIDPWLADYSKKKKAKDQAKARAKAKVERKQDRKKREAMKSIADLIREAQTVFNAWVRTRDEGKPCICCGRTETTVEGLKAHGWDAGHYRSTGSASHLRFNPDNAHRQLVWCNRYGAGRAVDYRIGLIARIGLERVEALEADNRIHKWEREELTAIRDEYRAKLKALKSTKE